MATSGSVSYASSGTLLIESALETLARKGLDKSVSSNQTTQALKWLNMIIRYLEVFGTFQWKTKTAYLMLDKTQTSYDVGSAATAHWTEEYVTTTLSAAASSGDTTLTVTDTTGMTTGDILVIADSDGAHMTDSGSDITVTVASSTSLTLSAALTDDVTSGDRIYTYTTRARAPVRIFQDVARRDHSGSDDGIDTPVETEMYEDLITQRSDKNTQYYPLGLAYLKGRAADTGTFTTYGTTTSNSHLWVVPHQSPLEDFSASASNEPDFPQEYFLPLCDLLAFYLGRIYELPTDKLNSLRESGVSLLANALGADARSAPLVLEPMIRQMIGR